MESLPLLIASLSYRDERCCLNIGSPFLTRCEVTLKRRIQELIIHP